MLSGCDRAAEQSATSRPGSPSEMQSPLAVAQRLNEWHHARQYRNVEAWIVPEQDALLVDTLMAFNGLLDANRRAQERIAELYDEAAAKEFDLGELSDHLGMFSRNVSFRGERIDGNRAVVTVQVADRVPLEEYHFTRRDGRWLYAPQGSVRDMPKMVGRLADGMEDFARGLQLGDVSLQEIRSDYRHLVLGRLEAVREVLAASPESATSTPATRTTTASRS